MIEATHDNFRAVAHELAHRETEKWIVNVYRISDGRHLRGQRWLTRRPTDAELETILLDWIYEKAGAKEPEKVFCDAGCGTELIPDANMDTDYQFKNALWITFSGGYAMFIDPMDRPEPRAVICHDCAHALCEQHPWLNTLLNPHSSHSHPTEYVAANPDHFGWDYSLRADRADGNTEPLT